MVGIFLLTTHVYRPFIEFQHIKIFVFQHDAFCADGRILYQLLMVGAAVLYPRQPTTILFDKHNIILRTVGISPLVDGLRACVFQSPQPT